MTEREARVVRTALLTLAVAIAVRGTVSLSRALRTDLAELERKRDLVGRYRSEIRSLAGWEDSASSVTAAVAHRADLLFAGRTPESNVEMLARAAEAEGVRADARVVSIEYLADSVEVGLLRRFAVRAAWESDAAGIGRVAEAMESVRPRVRIAALRMESANGTDVTTGAEIVRGELVLLGYYLAKAEGASR